MDAARSIQRVACLPIYSEVRLASRQGCRFSEDGSVTMERIICLLAWAAILTVAPPAEAQVYEFTGGNWFDSEKFVAQTVYAVDGVLRFTKPANIERTVDLAGGYVVPPFGEAHNHDLASGRRIEEQISRYLWDGVFYVKLQSAFSVLAPEVRPKLNKPDSVDAVFAFAPVTGPGGHPIRLRETLFDALFSSGVFGGWKPARTFVLSTCDIVGK
jgi:hypothetical protein